MKMNVSEEEAKQCVDKVKERRMGFLFENMEKMDIQEERRKTAETGRGTEGKCPYNYLTLYGVWKNKRGGCSKADGESFLE